MQVDIVDIRVNVILTRWTTPSYLTYLLTRWSRGPLENLTGFHLVKKFPTFYGTRKFITAFTSARHLSLSWARSIQSIPPTSHFLKIHLTIIISSTPGSPKWSFSLRFPHQNPVHASPVTHTRYMPRPSHSSRFYHPKNIGWDPPLFIMKSQVVTWLILLHNHGNTKFWVIHDQNSILNMDNLRNRGVTQSHTVPMETRCDSIFHIKKT